MAVVELPQQFVVGLRVDAAGPVYGLRLTQEVGDPVGPRAELGVDLEVLRQSVQELREEVRELRRLVCDLDD